VPATLLWWGGDDGVWSTADNWIDEDTGQPSLNAPTGSDDVGFTAFSSVPCALSSNAACQSLNLTAGFTGSINLNLRSLIVEGHGLNPAGTLAGGRIRDGSVLLNGGVLNQNASVLVRSYLTIGGGADPAVVNFYSGSFNDPNLGGDFTPDITVNQAGRLNVLGSDNIYANLTINSGGAAIFAQSSPSSDVRGIGSPAVIKVNAGGRLDLDSSIITGGAGGTYIDNFGTVQKTAGGTTTAYMGLRNEASSSLLTVNGGSGATLDLALNLPGSLNTVEQVNGATQIYPGNELRVWTNYQQSAGKLSAMGAASGTTVSRLNTDQLAGTKFATIDGGSVVLGDGTTNHRSELISNTQFNFKSASTLAFGLNPDALDNDLLMAYKVSIETGATAKLDTTNLGDGAPPFSWQFIDTTADGRSTILGSFRDDVGGFDYYTEKNSPDDTSYYLHT
jgi:hypothetical protein